MRKYTPKGNVQKKAKYNDRFWVAPSVARSDYRSDKHFSEVVEKLSKEVKVLDSYVEIGQLVVEIEAEENLKALKNLKSGSCYEMCSELSAVDYLSQSGEFEIFYQLLNLKKSKRVRVITRIKRGEAIESVISIYKMANFAEREMYDMFGIYVNNHPHLKRIIMPDDWEGHPLLKDYPLEGDEFASWYEVDKIFGKEYRDVIGPEIRDQAMVDRYDTQRFARVGKEVPFGSNPEKADEAQTPVSYSKARFTNYTKGSKELDKRK